MRSAQTSLPGTSERKCFRIKQSLDRHRREVLAQKQQAPARRLEVSVPCVGACGGLLGLALGLSAYCDERAAPAFSNAFSGVTVYAKRSAAKQQTERAQASATSPSLSLIMRWITSFLVLARS